MSDVLEQGKQSIYEAKGVTKKLVAALQLSQKATTCRQNVAINACHNTTDHTVVGDCIDRLARTMEREFAVANSVDIPKPLERIRSEEYPKMQFDCVDFVKRSPEFVGVIYPFQTCGAMAELERLRSIRFLNMVGQLPNVDWSADQ